MSIAPELELLKHSEAVGYVNRLIIDLKLQLAGIEPDEPVTLERLNRWSKHRRDLEKCKISLRPIRVST